MLKVLRYIRNRVKKVFQKMNGKWNKKTPHDSGHHFISNSNVEVFRKVVWIPVDSISIFIPNKKLKEVFKPYPVHYSTISSFFWDGDWDLNGLDIDKHYADYSTSYRSMFQIFCEGRHYKDSDEFQEKLKIIELRGKSARGNSVNELSSYFESILELKERISKVGYKLQKEMGNDPFDEIGVFIGRDGTILKAEDKFCGTHRFAIAKILKLQKIPVCILAVHRNWMDQYLEIKNENALQFQEHNKSIDRSFS